MLSVIRFRNFTKKRSENPSELFFFFEFTRNEQSLRVRISSWFADLVCVHVGLIASFALHISELENAPQPRKREGEGGGGETAKSVHKRRILVLSPDRRFGKHETTSLYEARSFYEQYIV